jgi:hypothetical protein
MIELTVDTNIEPAITKLEQLKQAMLEINDIAYSQTAALNEAANVGERYLEVMAKLNEIPPQKVQLSILKKIEAPIAAEEPKTPPEPTWEATPKNPIINELEQVRPAMMESAPADHDKPLPTKFKGKLSPNDKAEIKRLYENGMSIKDLAIKYSVTSWTIRYALGLIKKK